MHRPEPANTEQSQAHPLRPTKGGAVRIRIALVTAMVVVAVPAVLIAFFSSSPAAARVTTRLQAATQHRHAKAGPTVMSYAQAVQLAKQADYYSAVTTAQEKQYLGEVAYLQALQVQKRQQAAAAARAAAVAAAQHAAAAASTAASPTAAPAGNASDATSTATADWACIRRHESGDNYAEGNGGAYQFQLSTWRGLTGLGTPAQDSPPAVQDAAALKLFSERGWEPWTTRYVCGL
jgi:hypothetical protein